MLEVSITSTAGWELEELQVQDSLIVSNPDYRRKLEYSGKWRGQEGWRLNVTSQAGFPDSKLEDDNGNKTVILTSFCPSKQSSLTLTHIKMCATFTPYTKPHFLHNNFSRGDDYQVYPPRM